MMHGLGAGADTRITNGCQGVHTNMTAMNSGERVLSQGE